MVLGNDGALRVRAQAVRRLLLACQGVLRWEPCRAGVGAAGDRGTEGRGLSRERLRGFEGVIEALRRLEAVQLDPVAVVDRNHHLVLRNRVADYKAEQLEHLYGQKLVFEHMANARCVMPVEDWGLFGPRQQRYDTEAGDWRKHLGDAVHHIKERLAEDGPLPSRLLDIGEKVQGYWDNAQAKTKATSLALERLWEIGEVVVAGRKGDERTFALSDAWLPKSVRSAPKLDAEEAWMRIQAKYMRAYRIFDCGDVRFGWRRQAADQRKRAVDALVRDRQLIPLVIDGVRRTYYILSEDMPLLEAVSDADIAEVVHLLPPLDNILWRRERLLDLFGFEYTWEIYIPPARRRFGPYAMPILEGDALIGRIDPRLDRRSGVLHIQRLRLEPAIEASSERARRVADAIKELASFCGASSVALGEVEPEGWRVDL